MLLFCNTAWIIQPRRQYNIWTWEKKGIISGGTLNPRIIYSGQREKTIYTGFSSDAIWISIKSKFATNKRNLTCYRNNSFLVLVTSHKLNFSPGQGWSGITIYQKLIRGWTTPYEFLNILNIQSWNTSAIRIQNTIQKGRKISLRYCILELHKVN